MIYVRRIAIGFLHSLPNNQSLFTLQNHAVILNAKTYTDIYCSTLLEQYSSNSNITVAYAISRKTGHLDLLLSGAKL